jgi:hypothetical protein
VARALDDSGQVRAAVITGSIVTIALFAYFWPQLYGRA